MAEKEETELGRSKEPVTPAQHLMHLLTIGWSRQLHSFKSMLLRTGFHAIWLNGSPFRAISLRASLPSLPANKNEPDFLIVQFPLTLSIFRIIRSKLFH